MTKRDRSSFDLHSTVKGSAREDVTEFCWRLTFETYEMCFLDILQ